MTRKSLRLRLSLAAGGLIALALGLAGLGLIVIFDRVLDARTAEDLGRTAKFLAGQVTIRPDGSPLLASEPPDARFGTPYGGLYWQIDAPGGELRSRSLWDRRLATPASPEPRTDGGGRAATGDPTAGPDGGRLISVPLRVRIGAGRSQVPVSIVVAIDRRDLAASRATFLSLLVPSLIGLGSVLTVAMSLFVQRALAPFRILRADLSAIHGGQRSTLSGRFPDEVQPLVDDLNRLIGVQERALLRARTQAGDMAHGLKTPLAVLTALARRIVDERPDLSREVEEQAFAMGRQVERSLVRARIAAAGDLRRRACAVRPVVDRLVSVLRRLPEADSLSWEVDLPGTMTYPGDQGDLTDMLGNLLDNARKWAHRRVVVKHTKAGLVIEDDGPGMSEAAIGSIARGRRWDETKPGSGFGIAISSDIAEETGARLTLGRADLGGLRVSLEWGPAHPSSPVPG